MPYGLPHETPELTKKMEDCVREVMKQGREKVSAIRICKASLMRSYHLEKRMKKET